MQLSDISKMSDNWNRKTFSFLSSLFSVKTPFKLSRGQCTGAIALGQLKGRF